MGDPTRLGRYTLLGRIGAGGMGEVFLARVEGPEGFEKRLALKRIAPALADDPRFRQRFAAEARLAAILEHPNVVQVYEFVEEAGALWLVMEYVDGGSLRAVLRRASEAGRPVPWPLFARIGADACAGLAYAHGLADGSGKRLGLVHRDVSPENLLLSRTGAVKLADFGLARAARGLSATRPGVLTGKPRYAAPERFEGREADDRADVFSLAATLYELFTGRPAFDGDDDAAVMHAVLAADAPDLASLRPDGPADLAPLLRWALARDPAARPTAEALGARLAALAGRQAAEATPAALAAFVTALLPDAAPIDASFEPTHLATPGVDPPSAARPRAGGLPPELTVFVGRAAELEALGERFARGGRLLTLLGPAGMGKTRLALRFAANAAAEPSRRVFFCDLTEARDADGIFGTVGTVLRVPLLVGATRGAAAAQLGRALFARGPALVLLDNFEQVVSHAPATVGVWLAAAPEARFLVTSRERLRLAGEVVYELAPLAVPGEAADIEGSEAVQLFVERARAVRPGFAIAGDDAAAVAELVRRLDGLPLAIELAAARVGAMEPAQLLARLARRFDVLSGARRDASTRQATLRGAIDWSWELLAPFERAALAQCAVFRGGFSLAAAEAVLDLSEHSDAPWIPDVVQALRDKSLVWAREDPEAPARLRLGLYESIRAYAAENLSIAQAEAVARRHAAYFLRVGAERAGAVEGPEGAEALRALASDRENLTAIAEGAMAADPAPPEAAARALEALIALNPLRVARGPLGSHLVAFDRAIEAAEAQRAAPELRARAHRARGHARRARGSAAAAADDFARACELARTIGDRAAEARALAYLGICQRERSEPAEARASFDRALELARALGDRRLEGIASTSLGLLAYEEGRMEAAQAQLEAALAILHQAGDRRTAGQVYGNLGSIHHEFGRLDVAREHYRRAVEALRAFGDRRLEGAFVSFLGLIAMEQDDLDEANARLAESLATLRAVGDRRFEGIVVGYRGLAAQLGGRLEEAREDYRRAIDALREVGDGNHEGQCQGMLGAILADLGRADEARAVFDAADRLLGGLKNPGELAALEVRRGHLDLARRRAAAAAGDAAAAAECLRAAERRIAAVQDLRPGAADRPTGSPIAARSEDVRFAVKLLERTIQSALGTGTTTDARRSG